MSPARIRSIMVKEFRQIRRDRRTLAVLVVVPVFLLVMYGYALNLDATYLPTVTYDADGSDQSRAFLDAFFQRGASEFFEEVARVDTPEAIDEYILSERARVGIIIPSDFSRTIAAGEQAHVQVIVDGVNANEASIAAGYAEAITQQYAGDVRGFTTPLVVDFRPRVWFNPELKSERFLLPGLIAFILMIMTVVATALSVVRERERGSMEQLTVSPLHPIELILGKLAPYALISTAATTLVIVTSYLLFDLPIRGSLLVLAFATLVFLCVALGLGLLISTIANTQETAFFMATFATLLPTFVLSGFVFPISNMPLVIRAFTYLIPARHFLIILRGVMLKGTGLAAFWQPLVMLAAFGVFVLFLGTVRLRRIMG